MRAVLCWKNRAVGTCGLKKFHFSKLEGRRNKRHNPAFVCVPCILTSVEQVHFPSHSSFFLHHWVGFSVWKWFVAVSKRLNKF